MLYAKMSPSAKVDFEEQCFMHQTAHVIAPMRVGAFTYFGEGCLLGGCVIGRFCSIGPGVKIGLGEHEVGHFSTHPFFYGSKNGFKIPDGIGVERDLKQKKYAVPRIGNDVWIGANVVIRRGVEIGTGAVIAAGAIVSSDVQPYSIVGGVPSKHIKFRFDDSVILELLESKWWDYDMSNFVGLDSSEPKEFLRQFSEIKDKKLAEYKTLTKLSSGEVIK